MDEQYWGYARDNVEGGSFRGVKEEKMDENHEKKIRMKQYVMIFVAPLPTDQGIGGN